MCPVPTPLHCFHPSAPHHNLCFAPSPTGIDRCAAGATDICGPGTCVNLPDGYRCICSPGYRLHPSQAYCAGIHVGSLGSLSGWGGWRQGWRTVQSPGSQKPEQCCVADGLRRAAPMDKANLNLRESGLWEPHLMSPRDLRRMGSHPRVPDWYLEPSALRSAHPSVCIAD